MNKYFSNILMLVVLLLAGTALTSCTHSDDPIPEPEPSGPKTYTLTIKASKSPDTALTRALTLEDLEGGKQNLLARWATTETIIVQSGGANVGTLTPQSAGKNVESSGSVTLSNPSVGNELSLFFPSTTISYAGQKGTLADIAANYDYATATAKIKTISGSTITADDGAGNDVTFVNQQAIVQFTLKEFSDGTTLLSPSSLTIDYGTESISLTDIPGDTYTTNGNGVLYVAIPGFSDQTLKLTATVGSKTYYYEKAGVTFENGTYRRISLKMFNPFTAPLTFEAKGDDDYNEVGIVFSQGTLKYSTDGTTWKPYTSEQYIPLKVKGNKVYFKNDDESLGIVSNIVCHGDCYVYGNIMSLIYKDYETKKVLPHNDEFASLFYDEYNSIHIFSHPSKELVLPATTLTNDCYKMMFYGCMNLERAPELPSTNIPQNGYYQMFYNCKKLKYVKCLATSIGDVYDYGTTEWLYNAGTDESLNGTTKTFVVNSSLTISGSDPTTATVKNGTEPLWSRGDSGIPVGWTVTK